MSEPVDYVHEFTAPGSQTFNLNYRFARVLEATDPVYLSFDSAANELKRRVGQEVDFGQPFKRITVRSETAQTIRMVFADVSQPDDIGDQAVAKAVTVENGPASPIPTEENAADSVTALDDVDLVAGAAAVTIAAANPNRIGVLISVPLDLPAGIRVGDTASATKGVRMTAGDVLFLPITGAVKAFSEAANSTDQTVNCTDVERS